MRVIINWLRVIIKIDWEKREYQEDSGIRNALARTMVPETKKQLVNFPTRKKNEIIKQSKFCENITKKQKLIIHQ